MASPTDRELLVRLERIEAAIAMLGDIVTRRVSQEEHARRLGISARALRYRIQKARTKMAIREATL